MNMRLRVALSLMGVMGAGCAAGSPPVTHESTPTLSLNTVAAVADGVSVGWFLLETTLRGANGDLLSPKPIARVTVERQDLLTGKWTLAADLPASARTYLDRDVDYGTRYRYRVTGHLVDGGTTSVESADPVKSPPLWSFRFSNAVKPAEAGRGMVYVRIEKFQKGVGKVEARHLQVEGDRIGFWAETPGSEPSSLHRVTLSNGKEVDVDFKTGATLSAVQPTNLVVAVKRCRVIYDGRSGDFIGCERVLEKRSLEVHQISYQDSEGAHQITVPDPGVFDQVCGHHPVNPDPRPLQAHLLLEEADRLWTIDSGASIRVYQRLLKDYPDIVIRLQVRNRVEGRARQAEDD